VGLTVNDNQAPTLRQALDQRPDSSDAAISTSKDDDRTRVVEVCVRHDFDGDKEE
jgi:hypothetical protein